MAASDLAALVERLEKVTSRLEKVSIKGGGSGAAVEDDEPPFMDEYREFLKGNVATFLKLSKEIGGDVCEQGKIVEKLFNAQKDFLSVVGKYSEPSKDVLQKLLQPTSEAISEIQDYREKNRKSQLFNHLSAVSEGIPSMGWVAVSPKPAQYVKDMGESAQFYTNRVVKDYKEKDQKHVEWARTLIKIINDLQEYVKQNHTPSLKWNREGKPATADALKAGSAAPVPPSGGPPPPPAPAPPPPVVAPASSGGDDADSGRAALFDALNKGADITKGLKKVTKDMQTHKNPELRKTGPVPGKPSSALSGPKPFQPAKPMAAKAPVAVKKPPVLELQGKKWIVEHQEGNRNIVIDDTNTKQTVYVFKCNNSVIQVKGKVNAITLDGCTKTALVFDDLVSTAEMLNCKSVQVQANGKVPTISIDKTDGCQVYLSENNLDVEIVTAKSSEMNVLVPKGEGDYAEYAIPEQFKTTWTGKGLKTEVLDIAG